MKREIFVSRLPAVLFMRKNAVGVQNEAVYDIPSQCSFQ